VELSGEYVENIYFFNHIARCFLYKAKDLSAPSYYCVVSSGKKYQRVHLIMLNCPWTKAFSQEDALTVEVKLQMLLTYYGLFAQAEL
jgi:hypothetical protein